MHSFVFYFFASILILACLAVVFARNPLYNVLSLVLAIFCLSSIFISLEAYFVGVILLLVYAGAVLVFFLFVVMVLNINSPTFTAAQQRRFQLLGGVVAVMFLSAFGVVWTSLTKLPNTAPASMRGTIESLGQILFTDYLLPFELTSLLLLIAIFGIVSLAKGALRS